jgi:uncharacterized protein DUF2017
MRRFRRLSDDVVQLRLMHAEKALLLSMLPQLQAVLTGGSEFEHLRQRLFPKAYEDPEQERDFRLLVGDDLKAQRDEALATVVASLDAGRTRTRVWTVELDDDQVSAWLSVLHDLRLVLAQLVGITTEADWSSDPVTADPGELVLWHIGALQEDLLAVLMGGLEQA